MKWEEDNGLLTKEFELENYVEAVVFITKICEVAEEMNHHPDILLHSYKKVKVSMCTHDQGNKITELDYETAQIIDEAFEDED